MKKKVSKASLLRELKERTENYGKLYDEYMCFIDVVREVLSSTTVNNMINEMHYRLSRKK